MYDTKEHGNKKQLSLMKLFLRVVLMLMAMWAIILTITLSVTMRFSIVNLEEKIESCLTSTASTLARSQMVLDAIKKGECSDDLIEYLDSMARLTADLDVITIAGADSIRLYHVVPERIGERFVGDDQYRALQGESYISEAMGTLGLQRRAFCPIYTDDGTFVQGFIMVSAQMESLDKLKSEIYQRYLNITVLILLVTLCVSSFFTLMLNHYLRGFSLEWLVHNYFMQNDLINSLDEGVILTNEKGLLQFANKAAETMLGQKEDILTNQLLDELILDESGESLLIGKRSNAATSRPNVLCGRVRIQGRNGGHMLLLKDRSEVVRRAQDLAGTRHIISALRANTHEFMNKLQVISGLMQMEKYDEVREYIGEISNMQSKAISPVLQHIHNPSVAALLLGKLGNMRELDINMTLLTNSYLPEHSSYLSTTDLVTLTGNIVENAIEAINVRQNSSPREIVLQLTENDDGLLMMVSDTGIGIRSDDIPHIYESGFSTKAPEGRGIGMGLVREIVQRRQGDIEVDSESGVGTAVTIIFHSPR